ncbi:MAG: hypothetical protein R3Y22_00805 [Bacteroidales bacterium]
MDGLRDFGVIPIDYALLGSILSEYRSPRNKVAAMERSGDLVRLKRGLYVVSPKVSGRIISSELIANHIYGPSYLSMESALRYYGLIPESVYALRSMTLKRSKAFENQIGRFDYTFCPADYYSIGICQHSYNDYTFLIASAEKALCDLINYTPLLNPRFVKSMSQFLEEDLRLDMDEFYKMDVAIFRDCARVSKKRQDINNLIKLLER